MQIVTPHNILLCIRLYALAWNDHDKRPCSGRQRTDSGGGGVSPGQRASAAYKDDWTGSQEAEPGA